MSDEGRIKSTDDTLFYFKI